MRHLHRMTRVVSAEQSDNIMESVPDLTGRGQVASQDVVGFRASLAVCPGWPSGTSVMVGFARFDHEPVETPVTGADRTLTDWLHRHGEGDFLRAVT